MLRPQTSAALTVYCHPQPNGHSMLCPYRFYIASAQIHTTQKIVGAQHAAPANIRGTHRLLPSTTKRAQHAVPLRLFIYLFARFFSDLDRLSIYRLISNKLLNLTIYPDRLYRRRIQGFIFCKKSPRTMACSQKQFALFLSA